MARREGSLSALILVFLPQCR